MNQSSEGTISPASSSRIRASSAARSRCASAASRPNGGSAGGNVDGKNASTSSPAKVVRSYRPVARWLIDLTQLGTISLLWRVAGTISFPLRSLETNSLLVCSASQVIVSTRIHVIKELSAVSAFALLWILSIGTAYAADPAATIAALDARLAKIGAAKLEEPRGRGRPDHANRRAARRHLEPDGAAGGHAI